MKIKLSAPSKSGFTAEYETTEAAREQAAYLLDIPVADMIEVDGDDATYCYASQSDADADQDGAYAVKYAETD